MTPGAPGTFGAQLKALREAAGFTQEELATIADLSVHAVSALERGERRRPQVETVRALSAALDLPAAKRDALIASARAPRHDAADELTGVALPVPLTALLGRDDDIDTLRSWLGSGARLITLTGPGGVGKTRLALELARLVAEEDAYGVVFAPLGACPDVTFVAPAIAEAFGLSDVVSADLTVRVRTACNRRPILMVLDNCEHVLDAAPLVADLLTSTRSLRILATGRAPLHLRGERQYAVGPLALDEGATTPADLALTPAVRLFIERVREVQPEFRLVSTNAAAVAGICRRLDALPLAIELAAPWIKVLTPGDLLQRLERDVLNAAVGGRDLPERQQTIGATVAWSYHLLDPDEQRAFRRLSTLPGRFSIEAAAAVLDDDERCAGLDHDDAVGVAVRLIDRSLLQRVEPSPTKRPLYQMLETVRAYASIQLEAHGERAAARDGLICYVIAEAAHAGEGLTGTAQAEWLNRVRADLESYRLALTSLMEQRRADEAAAIASHLMFFWLIRGHAGEGVQWCRQALNLPAMSPAGRASALATEAILYYSQGELQRARAAIDEALLLGRDTEMGGIIALGEMLLGHLEHLAGNLKAARTHFTASIAEFEAMGSPWGAGNALSGLAWVALAAGDGDEAIHFVDRAASALHAAGPWFRALGLYVRACVAVQRGQAVEAIAFVRESLARIREMHDKFAFVHALMPLAAAAVLKGNDAWAARVLGARDAVAERTGATVADQVAHDLRAQAERAGRARLGDHRWTRAYAAGRSASIDSLADDIELVPGRL